MSLKSHVYQEEVVVDCHTYVMNETGAQGRVVVHVVNPSGVGASMDDSNSRVQLPNAVYTSGEKVAGVLLTEVVNYDLTRQHLNQYKRQQQVGGKVDLLKVGGIVCDTVVGTPTVGDLAYGTTEGYFTAIPAATLATVAQNHAIKPVGTFRTAKDTDGYCKIDIHVM